MELQPREISNIAAIYTVKDCLFEPFIGFRIIDSQGFAGEVVIADRNFLTRLKKPLWLVSFITLIVAAGFIGVKDPLLLAFVGLPAILLFLIYRFLRDLFFPRLYKFELRSERPAIPSVSMRTSFSGLSDVEFTTGITKINDETFKIEACATGFYMRNAADEEIAEARLQYLGILAATAEDLFPTLAVDQAFPDIQLFRKQSVEIIAKAERNRLIAEIANPASYAVQFMAHLSDPEQALLFFTIALVARKAKAVNDVRRVQQ